MIQEVKNFLKEKCIEVPTEWIPACIDFVKSQPEYRNNNLINASLLKSLVFEQWLHADLTELASCCLPFGLSKQKSTIVNGKFPLQVNSVRDVGLSAYSQLQKLKKDDVQNSGVAADVPHIAAWEPKPTRMLFLELTDGTSIISGMEYSFIPCLSLGMKPGVKILVHGSIQSRRGVLLLAKENVHILGGEVDSLLVPNAQENVLNKALGLEETEAPTALPESCINLDFTQTSNSTQSQYYSSQRSQQTQNQNNFQQTSNLITNNLAPQKLRNLKACLPPTPNVGDPSDEFEDMDDFFDEDMDDFFDDDVESALMEVEKSATANSQPNLIPGNKTNTVPLSCGQPTIFNKNNSKLNPKSYVTEKHNRVENNVCIKTPTFSSRLQNTESSIYRPNSTSQSSNSIPVWSNNNSTQKTSSKKETSNLGSSNKDCFEDSDLDDEDLRLIEEIDLNTVIQSSSNTLKDPQAQNYFPVKKKLVQSKITSFSTPNKKFSNHQDDQPIISSTQKPKNFNSKGKPCTMQENYYDHAGFGDPLGVERGSHLPCSDDSEFKEKLFKKRRLSSNDNIPIVNSSKDDESRKKIQCKAPFQYIRTLDLTIKQKALYMIKGFFLTLLSKLEQVEGKWRLTAKVNDGTASCDVHIDDQVLSRLIGMTVAEFKVKKEEAKSNQELKNFITQCVINCQKELITLCCLMELEVGPHLSLPKVNKLTPLTTSHFHQLKARLAS